MKLNNGLIRFVQLQAYTVELELELNQLKEENTKLKEILVRKDACLHKIYTKREFIPSIDMISDLCILM